MAITTQQEQRTVPGADIFQTSKLTLDNNYPTGGYSLKPKQLGLTVLRRIIGIRPSNLAAAAYTPVLLVTTGGGSIATLFLALTVTSTGAQVANGTDVSAATFHIIAEGN